MSLVRLLLIPVCVWAYCVKKDYALSVIILVLSALTDVADGFIARRFNLVSDVGKVLDPIADKATQFAMLCCLLTRFWYMILPMALIVLKEVFAGITGLLAVKKTQSVPCADWHGKLATVLLYAMIFLHMIWIDIPGVMSKLSVFVCMCLIILSFVLYGIRNITMIRSKNK